MGYLTTPPTTITVCAHKKYMHLIRLDLNSYVDASQVSRLSLNDDSRPIAFIPEPEIRTNHGGGWINNDELDN